MSSLQRYKKSGGFVQLLSLLESFPQPKKEKFLEVVESESRVWAHAIREKMLSVERIFSWPDQVLAEVFKRMNPKTMAFFMYGLSGDIKVRCERLFSASELRRMEDILTLSTPKSDEVASMRIKLIETARKMITDRELYLERFDAALMIPDDFETLLENQDSSMGNPSSRRSTSSMNSNLHSVASSQSASASAILAATGSVSPSEFAQLQQTLNNVLRENRMLKDELKLLHDKLEQIRRIA